jgi:hypothetical protein
VQLEVARHAIDRDVKATLLDGTQHEPTRIELYSQQYV